MGCRSILAVAAVAVSLLGVEASPCKPATSTTISITDSATSLTVVSSTADLETYLTLSTEALSTDATSETLVETTSTAEDMSATLIETTLTTLGETTPATLIDSTSTNVIETTATTEATASTVLIEESSTTPAASTTTTEAEACTETQVIVNPGFDDNMNGYPWYYVGDNIDVTDIPYYSAPHSVRVIIYPSDDDHMISQTLHNLKGKYALSYRFKVQDAANDRGFTCSVRPKIGDSSLEAGYLDQLSDPFVEGTGEWSTTEGVDQVDFKLIIGCFGQFDGLQLHFDDITLTKVCDADLKPKIE